MAETSLLVAGRDPGSTVLTLNRPHRRNALSIELMERLCGTIDELGSDSRERVVVLHGTGPAFCAGLDLKEAADPEAAREGAHWVARTYRTLRETDLVTVAAAHGAAYAGGVGLLACCDLVVAADDLAIRMPEVRLGLVPAMVSAVLAPRIPAGALSELAFLAEPIGAHRALELGLVQKVVEAGSELTAAEAAARTVLEGAPGALRATKRLLRELRSASARDALDMALDRHIEARSSVEAREGLGAFFEGREPRW